MELGVEGIRDFQLPLGVRDKPLALGVKVSAADEWGRGNVIVDGVVGGVGVEGADACAHREVVVALSLGSGGADEDGAEGGVVAQ